MEVIKIGDIVLVPSRGWEYTTHMRYAEALGLDNFDYQVAPQRIIVEYEVVSMLYDRKDKATILGIQGEDGKQYIINVRGVSVYV